MPSLLDQPTPPVPVKARVIRLPGGAPVRRDYGPIAERVVAQRERDNKRGRERRALEHVREREYKVRRHAVRGERFGKLTFLSVADPIKSQVMWLMGCDCGIIKTFAHSNVIRGKSKCCGCSRKANKEVNNPLRGHRPLSDANKKYFKECYISGDLPRWMYK